MVGKYCCDVWTGLWTPLNRWRNMNMEVYIEVYGGILKLTDSKNTEGKK